MNPQLYSPRMLIGLKIFISVDQKAMGVEHPIVGIFNLLRIG